MKIEGHTPSQFVISKMITWLANLYRHVEHHHEIDGRDLTLRQAQEVMRHIAKQHNHLLAGSGLEGVELPVPLDEAA